MSFFKSPIAPQQLPLTVECKLHVIDSDPDHAHHVALLRQLHTSVGVGFTQVLTLLRTALQVERDAFGVRYADLLLECHPKPGKHGKALKLLGQGIKPLPEQVKPTPATLAEPRYTNSYRLIGVEGVEGSSRIRFRILERFEYVDTRSKAGKVVRAYTALEAKTFQALLSTWLAIDLSFISKPLRAAVFRKAAETVNSHVQILAKDPNASFPSTSERDPNTREREWCEAIDDVSRRCQPFPYQKARELYPGDYAEDDPRGDRLVNVDPVWRKVVSSPIPFRLPACTTDSLQMGVMLRTEERVYHRYSCEEGKHVEVKEKRERYYAVIPAFEGVSLASPIGKMKNDPRYFWWQKRREEFRTVASCGAIDLPEDDSVAVIPLALSSKPSSENRIRRLLQSGDWKLCIASLTEEERRKHTRFSRTKRVWKPVSDGKGKTGANWDEGVHGFRVRRQEKIHSSQTEWWLKLSLAKETTAVLRPNVLGLHFETDTVVRWCLMNRKGEVLERGALEGNPIIEQGLVEQNILNASQRKHRNVKGRTSGDVLEAQTRNVCRHIVGLLVKHDANLAFENIRWVDKQGGGKDANRKHSMWNFGRLPGLMKWLALREGTPPIPTVSQTSDFRLRFTCPACRACWQAGQKSATADTVREEGVLLCRKCGYRGNPSPDFMAELVAQDGVVRANTLAKKHDTTSS